MGDGFTTSVAQYIVQFSNSFFACPRRLWGIYHIAKGGCGWQGMAGVDACGCPLPVLDRVQAIITYIGSDGSPVVRKFGAHMAEMIV